MSWNMSIEGPTCPTCNHRGDPDYDANYTHNCNSMMRRALDAVGELAALGEDHLYALDGKPCREIGPVLARAMDWWKENRAELAKMNPENGWGDEGSAYKFWRGVADACLANPDGKLRAHG